MTTRIADDYPSINKALAKQQQDRKLMRFQAPAGVTIRLRTPERWNPQDGLCYVLHADVGRLGLLLWRNMEPDTRVMDQFFDHLREYFPSARLRTPIEIALSMDDTQLLVSLLQMGR